MSRKSYGYVGPAFHVERTRWAWLTAWAFVLGLLWGCAGTILVLAWFL